jgi:hypothetical protein
MNAPLRQGPAIQIDIGNHTPIIANTPHPTCPGERVPTTPLAGKPRHHTTWHPVRELE